MCLRTAAIDGLFASTTLASFGAALVAVALTVSDVILRAGRLAGLAGERPVGGVPAFSSPTSPALPSKSRSRRGGYGCRASGKDAPGAEETA